MIASIAVVFVCILVVGVMQFIKQDQSYKTAIDYIKSNPEIMEIVGNDISLGFFPTGSIQYENGYGNSDLTVKVKGEKKSISVHIILHKEPNTSWMIDSMDY